MQTLFDYITHVKGIEYIIAILSIGLFILFWEVLKPKPFTNVMKTAKDDAAYIRKTGYGTVLKTIGKIVAAPFIGLAYVVVIPFAFFFALLFAAVGGVVNMVGGSASFGWRPVEAYLTGRKKKKKPEKEINEDEEEEG